MASRLFKNFIPTLALVAAMSAAAAPLKARKSAVKPLPAKKSAVAAAPVAPAPNRPVTSWTRTVRVTDNYAGAYYADTLALVVDGQFLVVPWTFISEAWLNRPGARLRADGVNQDLMLVDVDLTANLALLKSLETVLPTLNRGSIRPRPPHPDESLLVLSARDSLRPGAHFIQAKGDGSSWRYQIAMNSGDLSNVRYIVDRSGQLVAVATVFENGEAQWSAPASAVLELLHGQDSPRPASSGAAYQRQVQLIRSQSRWTESLVPAPNAISLVGLDCQTHLSSIAERELASQIKNMYSLDCEGKLPLPVVNGYSTGMKVSTGDVILRSTDSEYGRKLLQSVASELFSEQQKSSSYVNLMTVPECRDDVVSNPGGGQLLVKFCTSGLKFEPSLADTAIAVATLNSSARAHYAVARLKGFNQENTKRILKALIENVRSKR